MSKLSRKEFESILEEAYIEGYNSALEDIEEDIITESENIESEEYEALLESELTEWLNVYNEAGSVPNPKEIAQKIYDKVMNNSKVQKFFKKHPEEKSKKVNWVKKVATNTGNLYKRDSDMAIGVEFITNIITICVIVITIPAILTAPLPFAVPAVLTRILPMLLGGSVGFLVGLAKGVISSKLIIDNLKSVQGKAAKAAYEKEVKETKAGLIDRARLRYKHINKMLENPPKQESTEYDFDLESDFNKFVTE